MKTLTTSLAFAVLVLSACDDPSAITRAKEPNLLHLNATAPPGAAPGTCWGKTVEPAVVETTAEDILVQPAQISSTGTVQAAPIYRTETRQQIVVPRRENWFQTPCAADLTFEFVASIQRALTVRELYHGPINGLMDPRTRAAIRKFQAPEGLDSGILSVAAAQKMGLWTIARDVPVADAG
ncbi:MAG: peptidoglycan-binding domain-containing protein [Aliishimia sp.]